MEPPREWPVKEMRANGDAARCSATIGAKRGYRASAASYMPRCTLTPRAGSSKVTGSNDRLARHDSKESLPYIQRPILRTASVVSRLLWD